MKVEIEVLRISPGITKSGFRNVRVLVKETEGPPFQSAEIVVFVDRDISDIDEIKAEAKKKAKAFITDVAGVD